MAGKNTQESPFFIPEFKSSDMESGAGIHAPGATPEQLGEDEMFIRLPFSDLKSWIYDNEILFQAFMHLPIPRLGRVKQLSYLAYVGPQPETQLLHEFHHTREEHSLIVAKIGEAILRNNGAPEELVDKASVMFLAHDMATPALGDAIKNLDKPNLDEEDNWEKVMDNRAWAFFDQVGITRDEMDDTIHNRGLLGRVLDIADRISYVMLDANQLVNDLILDTQKEDVHSEGYRGNLERVLREDPRVGDIYKDIVVDFDSDDIYFKDPQRLGRFLEIRALLTKNLYMHPVSQARDQLVRNYLKPYYTADESAGSNMMTPNRLRRMGDNELIDFITKNNPDLKDVVRRDIGGSFATGYYFSSWHPQFYPGFKTDEELEQAKQKLERSGRYLIRGQVESRGFKTATDLRVLDSDGSVLPFKEYDLETAERIQGLAEDTKRFYLFYEYKDRERINPNDRAV